MAKMKQFTFREIEKIVIANGYTSVRCTGSHYIYKKEGAAKTIVLAKKKHINACIARRLIKENNLIIGK